MFYALSIKATTRNQMHASLNFEVSGIAPKSSGSFHSIACTAARIDEYSAAHPGKPLLAEHTT